MIARVSPGRLVKAGLALRIPAQNMSDGPLHHSHISPIAATKLKIPVKSESICPVDVLMGAVSTLLARNIRSTEVMAISGGNIMRTKYAEDTWVRYTFG